VTIKVLSYLILSWHRWKTTFALVYGHWSWTRRPLALAVYMLSSSPSV